VNYGSEYPKYLRGDDSMLRIKYALLGIALLGIAGCGGTNQESVEQQQPATAQESVSQTEQPQAVQEEAQRVDEPVPSRKESPPQVSVKAPSNIPEQSSAEVREAVIPEPQPMETEPAPPARQAMEEPAVPQVQEPKYSTIPNGTNIRVRLQDPLDTAVNKTGDTFRAILDQDIEVNGNVTAPRGSLLEGELSNVARSGRVEGLAAISLQLVNVRIGNQTYPLQTEILTFEAESTKKKDAAKVGVGAGIGAVIGAIAGGGKGAAIGAAVGGGAGGATVLATRGDEVKFQVEDELSFVLTRDVTVKLE
jgi:hypothetical protein